MQQPTRRPDSPGSCSSTTASDAHPIWLYLGATALAALLAAGASSAAATDKEAYDLAGAEVHRNARDGNEIRYDQWRLSEDGSMRGNFRVERDVGKYLYTYSGLVAGRWQLDGDTLCVDGAGLEVPSYGYAGGGRQRICYRLAKAGFAENEYAATNTATGFVWQMFVYRER